MRVAPLIDSIITASVGGIAPAAIKLSNVGATSMSIHTRPSKSTATGNGSLSG